jgi:hypothetical protein
LSADAVDADPVGVANVSGVSAEGLGPQVERMVTTSTTGGGATTVRRPGYRILTVTRA